LNRKRKGFGRPRKWYCLDKRKFLEKSLNYPDRRGFREKGC